MRKMYLILLLYVFMSDPVTCFAADNKPPRISTNFVLEVYEDGKKTDSELYVDLKIMSKTDVQWTTVFLHSVQSIKDEASWWVPFVSRWDDFIYDVVYDNHNFRIKMKMGFASQEMIVIGKSSGMLSRFNVEGVGFTRKLSGKNIKREWKSISTDKKE